MQPHKPRPSKGYFETIIPSLAKNLLPNLMASQKVKFTDFLLTFSENLDFSWWFPGRGNPVIPRKWTAEIGECWERHLVRAAKRIIEAGPLLRYVAPLVVLSLRSRQFDLSVRPGHKQNYNIKNVTRTLSLQARQKVHGQDYT